MGADFAITHNFIEDANIPTLVSNKSIAYLNYKMKNYTIEAYYGDDFPLTSFVDNTAFVISNFAVPKIRK